MLKFLIYCSIMFLLQQKYFMSVRAGTKRRRSQCCLRHKEKRKSGGKPDPEHPGLLHCNRPFFPNNKQMIKMLRLPVHGQVLDS